VPVSGTIEFDGGRWSLTGPPLDPFFPFRQFTDQDPASQNGQSDIDIDTEEWIRVTTAIGGPLGQTVTFNRDLATSAPAGSLVSVPFNGQQSIGYLEGSEYPSFTGGDVFSIGVTNNFAYFPPGFFTGFAPGDTTFASDFSTFSLAIATGFTPSGDAVNLFGPGAPFSFDWLDTTPGLCGPNCDQAFTLFGHLSHFAAIGTFTGGADVAFTDTQQYEGDVVFSRVTLQPVPEPSTLTLLAIGGAAWVRRRWSVRAERRTFE